MYRLKKPKIHSSEVAGLINKDLVGKNIIVTMPASFDELISNCFICITSQDKYDLSKINDREDILVITDIDFRESKVKFPYIVTINPKLDFIKAVNEYFIVWDEIKIAESAKIHSNAKIGRNVSIGENVVIGPDVSIGENSRILNNVVITNQVNIGNNCTIKHNSTIGSEGFDFEIDKFGVPIHYPHIGKISIGDNVWVGANSSIECGKIKDTIIENDVKIDDLVQLGYNCRIGERTLITAGVIIERDVCIGKETLIAPNATIRDNIIIGDNVIVGEGAVVVKNIENSAVYVGNPAKFLRKNK